MATRRGGTIERIEHPLAMRIPELPSLCHMNQYHLPSTQVHSRSQK